MRNGISLGCRGTGRIDAAFFLDDIKAMIVEYVDRLVKLNDLIRLDVRVQQLLDLGLEVAIINCLRIFDSELHIFRAGILQSAPLFIGSMRWW